MPSPRTSPKGLLAEAQALRDKANDLEAKAIRAALEVCDWYEAPAADMLGMNRSTLKKALTTRLKEIGEEAARKRAEAGYGVEDHVWTVAELLDAALNAPEPPPLDVSNGPGSAQLGFDFRKPPQAATATPDRPKLTLLIGGRLN